MGIGTLLWLYVRCVMERNVIVFKGNKIPCKHIENLVTVYDGQTTVRMFVTQGEDEDPDWVQFVVINAIKQYAKACVLFR